MQDIGKIITGIIVFLILLSIPVIVSQASGKAAYVPELQLPDPSVATDCVESKEYMRVNHMDLLFDWRALAVRDDADYDPGLSYYTATDGEEWFMSLTETCLDCHTDRDVFCNKCHEYTATQPNCWDCHNDAP